MGLVQYKLELFYRSFNIFRKLNQVNFYKYTVIYGGQSLNCPTQELQKFSDVHITLSKLILYFIVSKDQILVPTNIPKAKVLNRKGIYIEC